MAAKTETLTIALPIELLENIRANVAAGKFASESEAIVQTLREADDFSWLPDESFGMSDEEWEKEAQRRIAQFERGETQLHTLEEVRQQFGSLRQERISA